MLSTPSAFDRVNVRRLFIVLEKAIATAAKSQLIEFNDSLSGGADGRSGTALEKYSAWTTHFQDAETVDISFLVVGSTRTDNGSGVDQDLLADWTTMTNQAINLTEARKDCVAVVSPRRSDVVSVTSESTQSSNVKTTGDTATSSSYALMDSTWVYQYDRFNDRYVWIPACGHTAGIMARADLLRDPWFSPAGFSRGQYLGITKLAFNPKQASRDDLYNARINPVVTFPGQGTLLYGDKTMLSTPSAFDRINVRRLFIVLEKAIATAAKSQLFEFNDSFTRAQFRAAVEPFLRDVKNRRGLIDFSVLCDETNNTDTVIDRNEFVCSIFVKPARSINFITLNFVAARSGVQFEEIYSAVGYEAGTTE
jgi:phage tail sheath protein FI